MIEIYAFQTATVEKTAIDNSLLSRIRPIFRLTFWKRKCQNLKENLC